MGAQGRRPLRYRGVNVRRAQHPSAPSGESRREVRVLLGMAALASGALVLAIELSAASRLAHPVASGLVGWLFFAAVLWAIFAIARFALRRLPGAGARNVPGVIAWWIAAFTIGAVINPWHVSGADVAWIAWSCVVWLALRPLAWLAARLGDHDRA